MRKILLLLLLGSYIICSCKRETNHELMNLVEEWNNRVILFPKNIYFTIQGKDTVNSTLNKDYRIITYVDSAGCMSCKLRLEEWQMFMEELDSLKNVSCSFFLHSNKRKELVLLLRRYNFLYPVCLDEMDSINKLNHFPSDMMFQTFLLDKENKVVAIGNPIINPKVRELFLRIISGKHHLSVNSEKIQTSVSFDNKIIDMGVFNWTQEQEAEVILVNTGDNPLVVTDVISSCGCISVEYNREPVRPGKELKLIIKYKAEHPEHFNKTLTLYSNTQESPLRMNVTGESTTN